jgi:uncharacterized protein YqgC (DUF456 family)
MPTRWRRSRVDRLSPASDSKSQLPSLEVLKSFDSAAAMEEFHVLHGEVQSRIEKQQEVTSYAIAFMAALAVAISFLSRQTSTFERLAPAYPIISIILSGFTLMVVDHDMNIAHIYDYIDKKLRPQLAHLSKDALDNIWSWNRYRAERQQGCGLSIILTGPISAAKYTMTLIPNLVLAGFIAYYGVTHSHGWQTVWYFVPAIVVIWTLCASLYIINLYFEMVNGKSPDPSLLIRNLLVAYHCGISCTESLAALLCDR